MTVSPVRPLSAAEAALRVELAPQPGQILKPTEVVPDVAPQTKVEDHIGLRLPTVPTAGSGSPVRPDAPPAEAVRVAAQGAATRQGGLTPLLADLGEALASPGLPAPLKAAIVQVLASTAPLGPSPSAAEIKGAVARSGLFMEAHVAAAVAPQPGQSPLSARLAAAVVASALAPGSDAKAALLVMRQALSEWLGGQDPPDQAVAHPTSATPSRPVPPYSEGPIAGQPPASPTFTREASPALVAHRLAQGADAALARQELQQIASLPDRPAAGPTAAAEAHRWMFEIPLTTPQGPAVAQFEVSRDGQRNTGAGAAERPPVWRARFSVDVEPMGPVHAHVALQPGRTSVTLWAERDETAQDLRAQGEALGKVLRQGDMTADVTVYAGAPRNDPPAPGHFVDQAS